MNMVWIHAGETLGREITEILDSIGVPTYSVWRNVLRKDNEGNGTRWDDAVFPGKNWSVQFLCGDEMLASLREKFQFFLNDDYVRRTGVEIYVHKAERLL
ncbi:PG0541 family transporter-associated protein [Aminivibrio sp.]|jgi:hypothetical protein|uniref:PG0541 family transporter-associated protein n=1 Tax=Aminivibrio sp. TaxID=1872489 RepID=UPI001A453BDC|nr:PG0541 family transporter-associated protein [Aminivibrio sp.]MBL3538095.1 hypothetical protein [Aminivibrio sp.]